MEEKRTILVVDDNHGSRYAMTRILETSNFAVKEADTGKEALRIARAEMPDLVVLDVHLPDIDGFEVCRILKAEPDTSRIPVLHITASHANGADMVRGLENGAESYLTEPVEPEVVVATIRTILRSRSFEEAARSMAIEWQSTFDAITDGVAVVGLDGRIQRFNATMARLLRRQQEELAGAVCYQLWGTLPAEKQPFFRALTSKRRESIELEYDSRLLSVTVDPVLNENGEPTGAVHIVSDISEKRRLEEQFRESQKFETIGTLAAGVAHDFNNLLTSIMGNASLILTELPEESPIRGKLTDVVAASERAAHLTKQLLAYSGKGRHMMQKLDLSNLVERTRGLVEASVPKKVQLELNLAHDLPRIDGDFNQLQQVVLNLVSNAAEAIGDESGVVTLATGALEGQVYVEVRDTGCGMDSDTKTRIFDPFFTTKFTGRGLGLAAVAGIARGHQASIHVTSAPGQGSAFRILFPAELAGRTKPAAEAPVAGNGTVLVVDDEEMVRRIAQATLEIRGYKVLLANNGLDAINQARRHPEISLVLLDLTMPVMGGEEAIDQILEVRPNVKVVVSTGYDQREAFVRFNRKQVAGFLQKPYTSRQLGEKIDSVLGTLKVAGN
ncbi:MAG TPA: response regulator [Candidatus Limnocylindrales bacterium]|nr:response regulator [Candidatus Limnocylindrales bacterium]